MQITANRRLAIYLENKQKQNQQKPASRKPIFSLEAWIKNLGEQLKSLTSPTGISQLSCLSPYEEELIWEKMIKASATGQTLVNPHAMASLAKEAQDLIQQWIIPKGFQVATRRRRRLLASHTNLYVSSEPSRQQSRSLKGEGYIEHFYETEETQAFFEWRLEYQKLLAEQHWVDAASVLGLITQNLDLCQSLPQEIECVGFTEFTPEQHNFFEALKNLGVTISMKHLNQTPNAIFRTSFVTAEVELHQAVLQSRLWLQDNPKAQIGLVVLDLEHRRDEIEEMLQRLLPKGSFNVAAPIPFAKHPIIAAALLGLSLLQHEIPLETVSRFLRCPFFLGGSQEQSHRASFDVLLHHLKHAHYTLEALVALLKSELPEGTDVLVQMLENLITLRLKFQTKQSTSVWRENIQEILTALGWGQGRSLNETEKTVQREWQPLLESYENLGKILGKHSFSQALFHLVTLANKKVFTPPVPNANIHALGLLEAMGLPFDYLWCMGFSDNAWPKAPAPNPLIPLSLQIACNLPRSHAARELQKAKDFTSLLSQGAKNTVVFSYPTTILDRHLKVSPLIKALPEQTLALEIFGSQEASESKTTRELKQDKQRIIPPKRKLPGSLRALSLQAQCPFKAFATLRLTAEPLQSPPRHLTKAERGEMIHEILYLFWRETQSQANLLALTDTMLEQRLRNMISKVLEQFQKRFPKRLTPRYKQLEAFRLKDLLLRFIQMEKTRPPFVVEAQELKTHCQIGPLEFSLRIDRIDALANGQKLLIDYKTGHTDPSAWFNQPLADPQLPLYCISRDPKPIGISLAVLKSNDLKYQGIASEDLSIPGVKPVAKQRITATTALPELSWETLCDHWYHSIQTLACDFSAGIATVAPISGHQTCRTCHLQSLCRVQGTDS